MLRRPVVSPEGRSCGHFANVAVTFLACDMVTAHVPVPEHAPDQPANVEPAAGVAVRVTTVPHVNDAEHVAPQLMPEGDDVTVPEPLPDFATFRA